MYGHDIFADLGCRRKALRRVEGEIDYDFQGRRAMEKQERRQALAGRVIWLGNTGPWRGRST